MAAELVETCSLKPNRCHKPVFEFEKLMALLQAQRPMVSPDNLPPIKNPRQN